MLNFDGTFVLNFDGTFVLCPLRKKCTYFACRSERSGISYNCENFYCPTLYICLTEIRYIVWILVTREEHAFLSYWTEKWSCNLLWSTKCVSLWYCQVIFSLSQDQFRPNWDWSVKLILRMNTHGAESVWTHKKHATWVGNKPLFHKTLIL